jgi:hypothetical protein
VGGGFLPKKIFLPKVPKSLISALLISRAETIPLYLCTNSYVEEGL